MATNIYVHPVKGLNTNPGSFASPVKTLDYAITTATVGANGIVNLVCGAYFAGGNSAIVSNAADRSFITGGVLQTPSKSGLTIQSYVDDLGTQKPILDGFYYSQSPADWTNVEVAGSPTGVWKITSFTNNLAETLTPGGFAYRLWLGSRNDGWLYGQREIGLAAARLSGPTPSDNNTHYTEAQESTFVPLLGVDYPWYSLNSDGYDVYVWTGSSVIDPVTLYGGLSWIQSGCSSTGIYTKGGQNNISALGLAVQGYLGTFGMFGIGNLSAATDTSGARLVGLDLSAYGYRAIRMAGITSGGIITIRASDMKVESCTVDALSTAAELPELGSEWHNWTDDVSFILCDTATVRNLTIRPLIGSHAVLDAGASAAGAAAAQAVGIVFDNIRVIHPAETRDSRTIASAWAANCTYNAIHSTGGGTRNQIAGQSNTVSNCVFTDLANINGEGGLGERVVGLFATLSETGVPTTNLKFRNNTFDIRNWDDCGSVFNVYRYLDAVGAGEITYENNVGVLNATQSLFGAEYLNNIGPTWDTGREQTFINNAAVSPDPARAVQLCGYKTNNYEIGAYVAYAPVAAGITATFTDLLDAGLSSPELMPLPGCGLIGAGTFTTYTRDATGIQRPNPPSIGAYDLPTQRQWLNSDPAAM